MTGYPSFSARVLIRFYFAVCDVGLAQVQTVSRIDIKFSFIVKAASKSKPELCDSFQFWYYGLFRIMKPFLNVRGSYIC